jgi:hypothetical protein
VKVSSQQAIASLVDGGYQILGGGCRCLLLVAVVEVFPKIILVDFVRKYS